MKNRYNPIVFFVTFLLVCACASSKDGTQESLIITATSENKSTEITSDDALPVVALPEGSRVFSISFPHLASNSDVVVIATVEQSLDFVNLARSPDDYSQPHPSMYSVGENYLIRIEDYLKSSGEENLFISHRRGILFGDSNSVSQAEIQRGLENGHGVAPLRLGAKYLMFLARLPHNVEGYPQGTLYIGLEPPWLFDISDPQAVIVDREYSESLGFDFPKFPPKPMSQVLAEINTPFFTPTPRSTPTVKVITPYPGAVENDTIEGDGTPYP